MNDYMLRVNNTFVPVVQFFHKGQKVNDYMLRVNNTLYLWCRVLSQGLKGE